MQRQTMRTAVLAGASFVALSKVSEAKTQHARRLGLFDAYFDGNDPRRADAFRAATGGGFDLAIEAVGSGHALVTCLDAVRPGGAVVLIGNALAPEVPFALNQAVLNEISLIGSVSCTRVEFEETIDLIAKGMIAPTRYVTEVLPLEGLQRAFERQCDPDDPALKFVVKP